MQVPSRAPFSQRAQCLRELGYLGEGGPSMGVRPRAASGLQAKLQNILKSWACPLPPGPRKCVEKGDGKHLLEGEFAEQMNVKYLCVCANLSQRV